MPKESNFIDAIQNTNWAIYPPKMEEIAAFVEIRLGQSGKNKDIEAFLDRQWSLVNRQAISNRDDDAYEIIDGVAVIPVYGVMSKRKNFLSWFFGGISTQQLIKDIDAAMEDSSVDGVVLDIDSPGGVVDGITELTSAVYEKRSQKPIIAYANGMMASAAYWLGSAAGLVVVNETAKVGSIGVIAVHFDYSKYDEMRGIQRTMISAGKYKAIASDEKPLSQEGKAYIQDMVDYYYSMFVQNVALYRNELIDDVNQNMADGKIFIGQRSIEVGLADQVGNLEAAIDAARDKNNNKTFSFVGATETTNNKEVKTMSKNNGAEYETVEQLRAAYPELVEEAVQEGIKSVDKGQIRAEAQKGEQARILELVSIQFGEESGKKFQAIIESGVSAEQFRAIRDVEPQGGASQDTAQKMDQLLQAIQNSGAQNPGADVDSQSSGDKDFMAMVNEYVDAKKCSKTDAMKIICREFPEAHKQWIKNQQKH